MVRYWLSLRLSVVLFHPPFTDPPPYFALTTKHYWSNLKLSWLDSPYFIQTFANQECSKFVKSVQMYSTTIRLNTIVALKYLQFGGQFPGLWLTTAIVYLIHFIREVSYNWSYGDKNQFSTLKMATRGASFRTNININKLRTIQ